MPGINVSIKKSTRTILQMFAWKRCQPSHSRNKSRCWLVGWLQAGCLKLTSRMQIQKFSGAPPGVGPGPRPTELKTCLPKKVALKEFLECKCKHSRALRQGCGQAQDQTELPNFGGLELNSQVGNLVIYWKLTLLTESLFRRAETKLSNSRCWLVGWLGATNVIPKRLKDSPLKKSDPHTPGRKMHS